MGTNEKYEGCPCPEMLRAQDVPSFNERINKLTGREVRSKSWHAGRSIADTCPDRVQLDDGTFLNEATILRVWGSFSMEKQAASATLEELVEGCPGIVDMVTTLDEQAVTIQVCGRTVLDAAQEANPIE